MRRSEPGHRAPVAIVSRRGPGRRAWVIRWLCQRSEIPGGTGMNKRLRIVIGLLLASVFGLLVWQALGPPEPVFEGRTLSSWLERHTPTSAGDPPYDSPGWKKADEALRGIGTNAIPTLLKMIRAKDPPPVVLKLLQAAGRYRWTRINYRYAY